MSRPPRPRILKPLGLSEDTFAGNERLIKDLSRQYGVDQFSDVFNLAASLVASLSRLVYVEGHLKKIPDPLLKDLFLHFKDGGIDDFSSTMWQNLRFGIHQYDGRKANFLHADTERELQVSRFGYDKYGQNSGKQIVVVALPGNIPGAVRHVIAYGGGGNIHREGIKAALRRREINGVTCLTQIWGIWRPIHCRDPDWKYELNSSIMRITEPPTPKPRQPSATPDRIRVESEQEFESETEPGTDEDDSDANEQRALEAIRAHTRNRATKRARSSSEMTGDIPYARSPPAKRNLRIVFHDSKAEDLARRQVEVEGLANGLTPSPEGQPEIVRPHEPPPVNVQPTVGSVSAVSPVNIAPPVDVVPSINQLPQSQLPAIVVDDSDVESETPVKEELHQSEPMTCASVLLQKEATAALTIVDVLAETQHRSQGEIKRSISEPIEPIPDTCIIFDFQDSAGETQESVSLADCNTAQCLFDFAWSSEIADRDTRLLEVSVADRAPVRVVKDRRVHFEQRVLQSISEERAKEVKELRIVVKKYC